MELTGHEAEDFKRQIVYLQEKKKKYAVGTQDRSKIEQTIALYHGLIKEIKQSNFCLVVN
jgi:hypothetical protein